MQTCSPRLWLSKKPLLTVYAVVCSSLAVGTLACAHRQVPAPTQAQAPNATEASTQTPIATAKSTPVPLRADCGGKNQPPCESSCGGLNDDCCQKGTACHSGLVCKNGTCVQPGPPCGGMDEACCVNRNPVCNNNLLKCTAGVCSAGTIVRDLTVTIRTNDEDKDDDSGVRIAIDGLAHWEQTDKIHYGNWSTHIWSLNPPAVRLDDLAGRYVSICMLPSGDDTWKFNFLLQGNRNDGLKYEIRKDNVFLSTDVPCLSWDATPDPTPKGTIIANDGKCLTITKGGAVGSAVALNNCIGGTDQEWLLVPEVSAPAPDGSRTGEIRHLGQCLGIPSAFSLPGVAKLIELQTCNNSPRQQWKWFGDPTPDHSKPTRVTGQVAQCFDPNGQGEIVVSTGGPRFGAVDQTQHFLQYVDCDNTTSQNWTLPVCGVEGKACCESGLPCQGSLGCKKGTCSAMAANVNDFWLTLETTNEDKDHDTQVSVAGLWSWPGDGDTPYGDWSTHRAQLTPMWIPLATIANSAVSLNSKPNGDDSWKLNFIVDAVREDGTHYEFRKDNVWLTSEGLSKLTNIQWNLGPPSLDLEWKDTDPNGFPLNPTWRQFDKFGACEDSGCLEAACPYHPAPLESNDWCIPFTKLCSGGTPNDYGRCSSQSPTYDRSALCGWHANWFAATFDGTIKLGGGKNSAYVKDNDFHVDFQADPAANIGRSTLIAEFDAGETTEQFQSNWWDGFDDDEHVFSLADHDARIIGLVGIDTEHGPHGELHPVYVFTVRAPSDKILGASPLIDTWGIFVRNWGNEGACGGSQHYLELTQFTLRFTAPLGAEQATSVVERSPATNFDAGSENGSNFAGFTRSTLSPVQHDANGKPYVEMTFTIGPPEQHTFIDGSLSIGWKCGNDFCPQPPAKPVPPPAKSNKEDMDVFPGANLLTKSQLQELQSQLPSRRTRAHPPERQIAIVPFVSPTPQLFQVGQGSLSDRTVPDPARQQRMVEVQKSICKALANDPKRPEICKSLP